uniref:Protein FAM221A n=1 Tax=Chromera velia CCMP2878 TaxID=1169474 RepID=A0A0G4FMJ3_9ALVE|eukprot:Cvel_17750.t1-p1 / transcript=Cvel_17750.t1 / gene=Cvel_17750 / organism=Chromera_velia_CCMP2878 / gene_product=Protein FAM221A, putative / transcript_product=Protein FAM221A, putative / location=Cvel_scaffold1434:24511-28876(-) / protein_length=791 / sequence_SO=supercontig / SO=protein_coding / is_pseudo=false
MPDLSSSFSSSYPVAVSGASHTHAHTRQQQTHHQGLQRERSFEALPGWKGKGGRGRPLESVAEHSASFSITQTSSHSHTTSNHQQKELSTLPLRQHVHGQQQSAPHLFNCECAHRDTATEKEKGDGGIGSYRESDSVVRRAAACPVCCQQAAVSCRSLREKGVLLKGAAVSVSASVSGGGGGGRRGSVSKHTNGGGGSVPCSSQMSNASSSTIAPSHSGGSLPQTGGTSREEDPLPLPPPQTQTVNGRSLRVLKDEREGRRLQRRERSVGGEHGGEVQHVDGSSSGWKPADQRSAVSLLSSVDGSVRASGGEVGGNGSGTRKEACGCGKRRPGRREAACFQEVAVSGSFADSLSPPPPIVRGSGTGASQVPQMAAAHAAVGGIEPPHPPCQEKRENEGKDPLAGEGGGTGETKKEKVWKTIVKWSCDHCKTECIPVREESRCLCGHRLKDHEWVPEKERSRERERGRQAGRSRKSENSESERGGSAGGGGAGRLVCKRNGCECGSFFYVVAEGAWVLRCSCKHKHTDHSPNSHRCRRNNCKCERFFSPWTCNCDHPWASHRQTTERVEARSHLPLDVLMEMLKADTSSRSQRDLVSLQQKQQRGGNLDEEAEAQQAAAGRGARQRRRQHSGSESGWAEHEALTASSSSHTIPPQQPRRERERERGEHCAPFSSERTVEPPPPPGRVWHGGSREDMGGRGGREEVGVSGGDKGKVSSKQQGGGGVPVALALPSRPNNSNNMAVAVAAAAAAKAAMEEFGLVTGEINDYSRLLRGGAFNDRPLPVQRGGASGW